MAEIKSRFHAKKSTAQKMELFGQHNYSIAKFDIKYMTLPIDFTVEIIRMLTHPLGYRSVYWFVDFEEYCN